MGRYRIVCANQAPCPAASAPAHITRVGTAIDPNGIDIRWTVAQVLRALQEGDTFYSEGVSSGQQAEIESYQCPGCNLTSIRSVAGTAADSHLDKLRTCYW